MLTHHQEKLIRSLHTKKGRRETGLCLVEGQKNIAEAGDFIEYTFTPQDTPIFQKLVTTETPQDMAGVARIPQCTEAQLLSRSVLVVLDGVQDPGNVGTILRLCLGFNATLLLVESADPTNPKVIRASAGAMFHVPWDVFTRDEAEIWLQTIQEKTQNLVYRLENKLENKSDATTLESISTASLNTASLNTASFNTAPFILIAGSEGHGIRLRTAGPSLTIATDSKLESLNVSMAVGITLHHLYALSL